MKVSYPYIPGVSQIMYCYGNPDQGAMTGLSHDNAVLRFEQGNASSPSARAYLTKYFGSGRGRTTGNAALTHRGELWGVIEFDTDTMLDLRRDVSLRVYTVNGEVYLFGGVEGMPTLVEQTFANSTPGSAVTVHTKITGVATVETYTPVSNQPVPVIGDGGFTNMTGGGENNGGNSGNNGGSSGSSGNSCSCTEATNEEIDAIIDNL